MNKLQVGLLVISILQLVISLIFLGLFTIRIHKLDRLASNSLTKDRSLKMRICCLLFVITLSMLHIVLSFVDDDYFMHAYKWDSLVEIVSIINFLLQLYIITREHKKKTRRSKSVAIFWVLVAIQDISTIIIV